MNHRCERGGPDRGFPVRRGSAVARVDVILAEANLDTELEVIRFAAERLFDG